ncbi:hypothetical protein D6C80_07602 [Aureobasidium pullulans]|nr:hypothetical protein D6C80_07602 [Aureobasidium pullulans]
MNGSITTPPNQPVLTPQSNVPSSNISAADKRGARARMRATRACDRCKGKKARCSGNQPCTLCDRLGLECAYKASYRRGRTPYILPSTHVPPTPDVNTAAVTNAQPMLSLAPSFPDLAETVVEAGKAAEEAALEDAGEESSISELVDVPSSYIGPASGVSFLTRAKKRLQEDATSSHTTDASTFASGDTPLPEYDSSFLVLPPKHEAMLLIGTYFNVSFPTHRYLHRPTVEIWCDELYRNQMQCFIKPGDREKKAIVLMVLAQATLTSGHKDENNAARSVMFYAASEQQLTKESGETRLTSVMSRLLQCHYLASQSRINHAWSLFGTTARLAFAVGLHRRQRPQIGRVNHVEVQCRRRTFWAVYSLDRYLSAALGRPKAIHDDDIDQDLPDCLDDENILPDKFITRPPHSQSVMQASICHIKLTRILSGILKEQYPIHPLPTPSHHLITIKHTASLHSWHSDSYTFVSKSWQDIILLAAPFSRQCEVLINAYSHAVILLHRPLLLCDIKTEDDRNAVQDSANACVEAALRILDLFGDSCEGGRMYGAFWLMQYYVFCAIAVLYVCIIRKLSPPHHWHAHLRTVDRCQRLLSQHALQASFARRYAIFLGELRVEAEKKVEGRLRGGGSDDVVMEEPHVRDREVEIHQQQQQQQDSTTTPFEMGEVDAATVSSLFDELTNWEELDSFVMAGINFDFDAAFASATDST